MATETRTDDDDTTRATIASLSVSSTSSFETSPTRASAPKLVQLETGKYIAVWEEQALAMRGWEYRRTMASVITITGKIDDKKIEMGKPVVLAGNPRLHRGDDALALALDGNRVAAWVTAGDTNRQLALHTVGEDLKHTTTQLSLP